MKKMDITDNRNTIEFACTRNFIYVSIFLFFSCFYYKFITHSDLRLHVQFIEELGHGRLALPHFLYHLVVFCVSTVSHLSFYDASCLTLASCIVFSTILIERILRHFLKDRYSDYFLLFVSVALMLVSAIYFPLVNKHPYLGIFSPNPWHNPTFIAAKPFVLLIFYLYILEIANETFFEKHSSIILISISLVICALIKPNFILAFVPSSIVFCFFLPGRKTAMLVRTGLLLLPVLAVLVFQFLFTYYHDASGSSSIQFCFFDVWQYHSESIPLAILQALAFPLAVLAVQFRRITTDRTLLFSWLLLGIGLLIFALLCETGHRKNHGNFGWTYISCLNILFVYSAIVFLRWASDKPKNVRWFQLKFSFCSLIFLLHLFSGIYYLATIACGIHY